MITLICARCRYECQTELQRVICPRCASIIETAVPPPGVLEPLELDQDQAVVFSESTFDLHLSDTETVGSVLEPDLASFEHSEPPERVERFDDVLDLPDSSGSVQYYNPAFAEPNSSEEGILLEQPGPATEKTGVMESDEPAPRVPRLIRLSEPKSVPASSDTFYFVPRERLAFLQGRSWRGPAIVAAVALSGFGLYSLQGKTSP